jgi:electron transport complex protein RnfG
VAKNEMAKLGFVLCIITLVVALMLSIVNIATADRIEQIKIQAQNEARKSVLPDADDFGPLKVDLSVYKIVSEVYAGTKDGEKVGYCIGVAPNGFGGPVELIVGIDTFGKITGVNIVNHAETPGLGSKATDPAFKDQYIGKSIDKDIEVIKNGTPSEAQIVAISGATITSDAVTTGVNEAIKVFNEQLK